MRSAVLGAVWTLRAGGSRSGKTPGSIKRTQRISTFQGGSTDGGITWTDDLISTASFDAKKSFLHLWLFHR